MEKTLLKGLRVLEVVARSDRPRGASDVALELGLTKSNAFRMLQSLTAAKYLIHDAATGLYTPSPRLFELGMLIGQRIDVREVSRPVLKRIVDQTGENGSVGILDGLEIIYVERADSPNRVRAVVKAGEKLPSYSSSSGKILLAWAPDELVDELAGQMQKFTAHTITNLKRLKAVLAEIRQKDWCVSQGEWHLEVSSVAVPVRNRHGQVVAALAVSGPTERFISRVNDFLPLLRKGAAEITAQLP